MDNPKIYYDRNFYEFDGVNWVPKKNIPKSNYLVGYKGYQSIEPFYPAQIYCPYIPIYASSSK